MGRARAIPRPVGVNDKKRKEGTTEGGHAREKRCPAEVKPTEKIIGGRHVALYRRLKSCQAFPRIRLGLELEENEENVISSTTTTLKAIKEEQREPSSDKALKPVYNLPLGRTPTSSHNQSQECAAGNVLIPNHGA